MPCKFCARNFPKASICFLMLKGIVSICPQQRLVANSTTLLLLLLFSG